MATGVDREVQRRIADDAALHPEEDGGELRVADEALRRVALFGDTAARDRVARARKILWPRQDPAECRTCGRDTCEGHDQARVFDASALLRMSLPTREPLIVGARDVPLLRLRDNVLIYAPAGVGKTWTRDAWAVMLARAGTWVRSWRAPTPRRVLIVDGEMPGGMAQDRLRKVIGQDPPPEPGYLRLLINDLQERPIPSLGSVEGQEWLEPHLEDVEVLFLDHLSALFGSMVENDAESWGAAQAWLLGLRRRGITVVLIHHAGRSGQQRGTSKREDIADLVLALKRPDDYEPEQGLRFILTFQKARGVVGPVTEPFEVSLVVVDGVARWQERDTDGEALDEVADGLKAGRSIREIAKQTGIPRSTVQRLATRARQRGMCPTLSQRVGQSRDEVGQAGCPTVPPLLRVGHGTPSGRQGTP